MLDFLRLLLSSLMSNCRGTDVVEINDTTATELDYAIPEHWSTNVRIEAFRKAFWGKRFEGKEGSMKPIIINNDFTKEAGDVIHFQTVTPLQRPGVTGASVLTGNEEKLTLGQFDLTVDWLRHAVGFNKRGTKRANFKSVQTAGTLLSDWVAREMDDDIFKAMISTVTPDTLYAGNKSSEGDLNASAPFDTDSIDRIKLALVRKGALPIMVKHKNGITLPFFGIVIDPVDAYNLRADDAWQNAMKDAGSRGWENPIFSGYMGIYNGCIIYVVQPIKGSQGTWLRPEAKLSAAVGSSGALTVTVTQNSDTSVDATKFFAATGYIQIEDEVMTYTAKTVNTFTVASGGRGALNTTSAAHASGSYVTQRNVSKQIGFGAESAVRGWGLYPRKTKEVQDYEFHFGVGIEAVYGAVALTNTGSVYPNFLMMKSYAENPSSI